MSLTELYNDLTDAKDILYRRNFYHLSNCEKFILKYFTRDEVSNFFHQLIFVNVEYDKISMIMVKCWFDNADIVELLNCMDSFNHESKENHTGEENYIFSLYCDLYEGGRIVEVIFVTDVPGKLFTYLIENIEYKIKAHQQTLNSLKEINIKPVDICKIIADYIL